MRSRLSTLRGPWSALGQWANALIAVAIIIPGLLLILALRLEWITLLPVAEETASKAASPAAVAPASIVRLSPAKLQAANLHVAEAVLQSIRQTRSVPGTITYDAGKRLVVTAPVGAVVVRVLVEPGQEVSAQQPLAILSSSDVGLARDAALQRKAELALARQEQAWCESVATNVEQLLSQLNQKPKLDELEKNLAGKILGDYREKIVAAYSKLVLAELTIGDIESLGNSGALSKRLVEERRSTREVAAAQFAAACETSRFSALQARDKARAAAEQAQRMLAIADEAVAKLLGPLADTTPVGDDGKLSELVLLAPLAGRIEERHAVEAARVAIGSPLFVVADTSTLWVSAEIHERDWPALSAAQLGPIEVRSPALIDSVLEAQLRFVGAEVDSATRSVPLVAQLDNSAGRLKPGMFVWVEVPLESPRQALVVSPAAIMRHENQPFVFVPSGQDAFRRVDVRLGLETRSAAEILAGLKEGDRVVDQGAFYLKSELLLESEE